MRVTLEGQYRNMIASLQNQMTEMTDYNYQISSGKKLQYLSDDPLASSELIKYKKRITHIEQYNKNITRGNAWLKATDNVLDNVEGIVRDVRTYAEQAATETYDYNNRKEISYHIDSMAEEIMQNANTDINGEYIFSGFKTDKKPFKQTITSSDPNYKIDNFNHSFDLDIKIEMLQNDKYKFSLDGGSTWLTGDDGKGYDINSINPVLGFKISSTNPNAGDEVDFSIEHQYQGDNGEFNIESNKEQHITINKTGKEVFTSSAGNIFKIMGNLWAGLVTNNRDMIGDQIDKLSSFEQHDLKLQAWTGSSLNRLDKISNDMLLKDKERTTKAASDIEDADVSDVMTKLMQTQTIYQATLKATAMISNINIMNFI